MAKMTPQRPEYEIAFEREEQESLAHKPGCICVFCFSRDWPLKNPGKCHVCGGAKGHAQHDVPYDKIPVRNTRSIARLG